jgi:hypothetical protein
MPTYARVGNDDAFITALHPAWTGALPATLLLDENRRTRNFWERPIVPAELEGPLNDLSKRNQP